MATPVSLIPTRVNCLFKPFERVDGGRAHFDLQESQLSVVPGSEDGSPLSLNLSWSLFAADRA
jgi:hypothetical protein